MCGISVLATQRAHPGLWEQAAGMLALIPHRGPDGEGLQAGNSETTVDPDGAATWVLGHRRLAILDLSDAGLQPMSRDQGQLWITYNGEVYNYVELARQLQQHGHVFTTGTDTEVILAAYQQWGTDFLARLRGMFALVLVDLRRQQMVAARDRLGIKPLYVWQTPDGVAMVSEPKQLTALPEFTPRLNRQLAIDYLCDGVLGHEPAQSLFQDVVPLEPGTYLTWQLGQRPQIESRRPFWDPSRCTMERRWADAVGEIRSRFHRSVELRLRSDVEVGTCLSGGLDSSSIVGVAARTFGAQMKTFSVCNDDPRISEERYVDDVNTHCKTQGVKLRLAIGEALDNFEEFIYHQDEPVFSLSQYAEFAIMRLAREHGVTVLLNGQGGDEALCGYRKYVFFYLRHLIKRGRIDQALAHVARTALRGDRQLLQIWQGTRYAPNWLRRRYDPTDGILLPDVQAQRRSAWKQRMRGAVNMHDYQWADLRYFSLPVLLRYQDRNSMAHGIEARVPMVDHEFVELALTLPEPYFFRRGMTKRLLVDAVGDAIPPSLIKRRTKLGFDTPQQTWIRGRLGTRLRELASGSERLRCLVDRTAVGRTFDAYRNGDRRIPHFVLFRLACLAVWLERFRVQ